jgi:hypothetical protein
MQLHYMHEYVLDPSTIQYILVNWDMDDQLLEINFPVLSETTRQMTTEWRSEVTRTRTVLWPGRPINLFLWEIMFGAAVAQSV